MREHKLKYVTNDNSLHDELEALRDENVRLRARVAELEPLVAADTLTPVANRRRFVDAVEAAVRRLDRHGTPAAVLFVDVDDLKKVNDKHGHLAGDALLIHIARIFAREVRATDVVARLGGDEFGMVLDHLEPTEARAKAAQLVELVKAEPLWLDRQRLDAGVSIGVTPLLAGDTADSALGRADADMYLAKARQRSTR